AHWPSSQTRKVHHRFHGGNLVTSSTAPQRVEWDHIVVHQPHKLGRIACGCNLVKLQGKLWRDRGDAGSVRPDSDAVVCGNTIVARTPDPNKPITDAVHDLLITPGIALSILPPDQCWDFRREAFHPGWARAHPVPAVDEEPKGGCTSDCRV